MERSKQGSHRERRPSSWVFWFVLGFFLRIILQERVSFFRSVHFFFFPALSLPTKHSIGTLELGSL